MHAENITIVNILRNCFPDQYQARIDELQHERNAWENILPIFFYNDTLYPYSPLVLHLFEPRYKIMIKRIVQASRKFAYLPCMHSYQASVGDVGVIAELSEVEFLPDGRAHVQAKCRDRFRILDTWVEDGTQGLHWCKVEIIHDEPVESHADVQVSQENENEQEDAGDANVEESQDQDGAAVQAQSTQSLEECARECSQMFEAMMENFGNMRSDIDVAHGPKPENPEKLSFWLASILPVPYHQKHNLLTSRSTMERLNELLSIIRMHQDQRA
ncbi:hypothetical protein GUITHDRAFT_101718 [Guillardia theta CCMP2712]|uniref:Lon N-terminal domain-containing protein n=2 Tax=Guillardia theta TaxID=55529 RepID=L1JVD8_GUITC|nr:hypothetical protein GUITHDRAFT_101718 [Guillardia theta CCMP2712]EKX52551.1 hypothetical protein GUITHDRAFT_101718 [Guillardia theta CCMP2712]|eukprot:XP_005839531.1 hypothetical protein GUITHDRAFT_101718 [Guillardia theta CCMP2712]